MPVILSSQDEMRIRRAMQNSPQNKRREEMRCRVEQMRRKENERKYKEADAFRAWEQEDSFLRILEDIRDANKPQSPDEPWNTNFCYAISLIPDVKRKARDLWLNYTALKEGGD